MADDIKRVDDPADPWRCQAVTSKGQCMNKAVMEGGNCLCHGGNRQLESQEKKSIRNYQLAKFQVEMNRHADSPVLKSLNDEVAILRMMLEAQLNSCEDIHDMMLKSHLISDLVIKIEKLVKSCHSLESSLGGLLNKQALLTFATKVIDIIGDVVEDEEALNKISEGIIAITKESENEDNE